MLGVDAALGAAEQRDGRERAVTRAVVVVSTVPSAPAVKVDSDRHTLPAMSTLVATRPTVGV